MVLESLYLIVSGATKLSILLFYRRLGKGSVSSFYNCMVRMAMVFVLLFTITFLVTLYVSCRPLNAFWEKVEISWVLKHKEGVDYKCYDEGAENLAAMVISVLQDLMACLMPTVLFWTFGVSHRQKIVLVAIFSVGILYVMYPIFSSRLNLLT
jgi:hypothetical protein